MKNDKLKRDKAHRFFELYGNTMFTAALQTTRNYYDAEDALQQACLSMFKNIDCIDMENHEKCVAYASIIAERKALDIVRTRSRQNEVSYEDTQMNGFIIEYTGDNRLSGIMAELPPQYREVLLLRYGMGYGIGQTAHMLDISVAACYKLISRAKARLRKIIEQRKEIDKNEH